MHVNGNNNDNGNDDEDDEIEIDNDDVDRGHPSTASCDVTGDANNQLRDDDVIKPVISTSMAPTTAIVVSPEFLQVYYARLFPFDLLHRWLSYSGTTSSNPKGTFNQIAASKSFTHREFSFTIESVPGEEIYIRYQSFNNATDLAAAVTKRRPTKIDIGAVFSHPPADHNTVAKDSFHPVSRELVFDIDLTDYDSIRLCGCTGASICKICWQYMNMAIQVVDEGLRTDFGFDHIAWFYSGRRGVHCWVCDQRARDLTDAGRSAVANYFTVHLGTMENQKIDLPDPLPPVLARAYTILEPMFVGQILPAKEQGGHGLLASSDQWNALLLTLPAAAAPVRDNLQKLWDAPECRSTPAEKWIELQKHLNYFIKENLAPATKQKHSKPNDWAQRDCVVNWCAATVFKHTYPRLDINVSKMRNHLLKSPFCVHPKTGRICVPIRTGSDATKCCDFDPFAVPTLARLLDELDDYGKEQQQENIAGNTDHTSGRHTMSDWEKTSLKCYYDPFIKEFLEPLQKSIRRATKEATERESATVGDF